jgi:hypothetical protein
MNSCDDDMTKKSRKEDQMSVSFGELPGMSRYGMALFIGSRTAVGGTGKAIYGIAVMYSIKIRGSHGSERKCIIIINSCWTLALP